MADKINVLDHGYVRLVDHMGSDISIVRAARVSYDAAWRAGENEGSDQRLIQRLMRDHHTSPFEAVEFQFEVYAPIFVVRQWHRHRTWSYNELSGRYRELPEVYYLPDRLNAGFQSKINKQGRDTTDDSFLNQRTDEIMSIAQHSIAAFELYHSLLTEGWPRELARMVLPVNTYTHMFAKVNLRNLLHFLDLRCDAHAQYEIRMYANALRDIASEVVPAVMTAWKATK